MEIVRGHESCVATMRDRRFYTRHVTQSSVASAPEQMKTVTPHIKRAYLLNNLLNEYKTQVDSLGAVIANAGFGVVLATTEGQIVYANDVAETLMRLRRGLCCRQGRIIATEVKASQKLQALISAVLVPTNETLSGGSMILLDQHGKESFAIHVVPVSRITSNRLVSQERLVAGLFIVDRNRDAAERVNVFAPLFGLTPAETRVLAALISGKGLVSAAKRLEMTEQTARTHLKHILSKTDTHRQAELMRLFYEVTIPCEKVTATVHGISGGSVRLPNGARN
jgi:DNA-binding CsgD family transcriptional regulator